MATLICLSPKPQNQAWCSSFLCIWRPTKYGFQPKTSPFSTRHLIWVNYEVLSQLFQPRALLFSYLNSARHNSVIELCPEQFFDFFYVVLEKNNLKFFAMVFLLFSIMHFFTFISTESSQFYGSLKIYP